MAKQQIFDNDKVKKEVLEIAKKYGKLPEELLIHRLRFFFTEKRAQVKSYWQDLSTTTVPGVINLLLK